MKNMNRLNYKGWDRKIIVALVLVLLYAHTGTAQDYRGLDSLKINKIKVFFSPEAKIRAIAIANRCDNVIEYYDDKVQFSPSVNLLVLNPQNWTKFTNGVVYGMPHYKDDKTLVVASENNPFWKSFILPLSNLPKEIATQISETYADENGNLTMQPFFDLLAIHELGHAFHKQAGLNMQRNWIGELFANIFLHTYIAENESKLLPALTIFPRMVILGGDQGLKYTNLSDFENHYDDLAQNHPRNYGWYQSKLHSAAADIFNSGQKEAFINLWFALKNNKTTLADDKLLTFLSEAHQSIADIQLFWNK